MDVERAQYLAGSNDCRGSDVWCWLLAAGGKGRGENCSTEKSSQCAGAGSSQLARYTSDMYMMFDDVEQYSRHEVAINAGAVVCPAY